MVKHTKVWAIEYEERSKGSKGSRDWSEGDEGQLWVLAESVENAISALRKHRIGQTWDWEDDDGKKHTETVAEVRLTKVECAGEIDLFA